MNTIKSVLLTSASIMVLFAGLTLTGCGGGDNVADQIKAGNSTNIRKLRNCYSMYTELNSYKGPKNKEELLEFLNTNNTAKARMERMGIAPEDLETMFVSDRDGEEFKVRWGLNGLDDHACVFESVGVDGKFMVAFATPREMEKDEYDDYYSGKLKGDAPGGVQDMMEQEEDEGTARGEGED